jgi:hypothetical protein
MKKIAVAYEVGGDRRIRTPITIKRIQTASAWVCLRTATSGSHNRRFQNKE